MRFESQIQIDFVAYDLFHRFGIIVMKVASKCEREREKMVELLLRFVVRIFQIGIRFAVRNSSCITYQLQ